MYIVLTARQPDRRGNSFIRKKKPEKRRENEKQSMPVVTRRTRLNGIQYVRARVQSRRSFEPTGFCRSSDRQHVSRALEAPQPD
jgi:hypothetical protein